MYISRIYIRNYKNFQEFDLFIPDGEPLTIIGGNNSGKTNLLKAIRLVLDSNVPAWEKKLTEEDFCWHDVENSWKKGEEIVITLTFSNVMDKEEITTLLYSLAPMDNSLEEQQDSLEANISFVFAPTTYKKETDYDLNEDYTSFLIAGRYHPSGYYYSDNGAVKEYEKSVFELHACDDKKFFYKHFYLSEEDIERIRENGEATFEKRLSKQLYANKIRRHINLLFLDAIRDIKNDFYQGYNSLVSQLLRASIQSNKSNVITDEITKAFKNLRTNGEIPETDNTIVKIENRLQNEKVNFLTDKADINIGTPKVTLANIGRYFNFLVDLNEDLKSNLDMSLLGLGYQNLAFISAIFALFELKKEIFLNDTDDKIKIIYNLLLIEEPEAHLDVQNQKFLHTQIEKKTERLKEYRESEDKENDSEDAIEPKFFALTQVVQSSHSTHLASKSDLKNIVVLQRNIKRTRALNIDNILRSDPENYRHNRRILKQYLDATRSALLFARKVVLVEGLSEKYALGTILNSYLKKNNIDKKNIDIDSEGIEIIEVGGKIFEPFTSLYSTDGLQNKCLSLRDGDTQLEKESASSEFNDIYNSLNQQTSDPNLLTKRNIFTFEIDTFFLPDPSDINKNNVEYLKLILYRFMKDGDYFKKEDTFTNKVKIIKKFADDIKSEKIDNDKVKLFFNEILGHEVSKPTLSLYLSSLIKAKLLDDTIEKEAWTNDYEPDVDTNIKKFEELQDFILPKYIDDGLQWLTSEQN